MSTYSPASFCMVQVGFSSLQKKWDPILSRLVTLNTECHRCKITSKQFQQKFIQKVYLLPLFPPCPWWPPPRRFWPWNYIEILFEKRADINIEWGFTLFLFLLFFKSWAESFRNCSSSSPLRKEFKTVFALWKGRSDIGRQSWTVPMWTAQVVLPSGGVLTIWKTTERTVNTHCETTE